MYHLIVFGNRERLAGGPETLESVRILKANEFTAEALVHRYGDLSLETLEGLQRFPAVFCHEAVHQIPARVGWITRTQVRAGEIRFHYEIEQTIDPIPMERLLALEWDLDFTEWEMNRTHWALKDVDLFEVLADADLIATDLLDTAPQGSRLAAYAGTQRTDIPARPSVFRIPVDAPAVDLVSVMMPFEPGLDPVYGSIGDVCGELGLTCQRADEIFEENEVIQDIFSLIYRSAAVICDFTGRNPNVYYEIGIAHTLGRPVIPITQSTEHVSFDVQHHRFISYINNNEGLAELRPKLTSRLRTVLRLR